MAYVGTFVSPTSELRSLWLWGSRVAYTVGSRQVVVCDLHTGVARVVRAVDRSRKYLGTVRAEGDTVVWEEFENPEHPDDPSAGTPWEIHIHDLTTRKTSLVATGKPRDGFFTIPEPQIEEGTVMWLDLPPGDPKEQGPILVSFGAKTKTRRVLSRGNFPYSPRIVGGQVFFSAKTDKGRDLHVVPADGSSEPQRLTHEGGVDELDARNGWVTWIRFSTNPDPNRTIGDEPVVVLRIGTTTTRVIASGQHALAGRGFVFVDAVDVPSPFVVATDGSDRRPLTVEGDVEWSAGWSVDGDRVAWVTLDDPSGGRQPAYLHIGRIERSR